MDKKTLIKITNRDLGNVGYHIPELGVRRQFAPRQTKEITFEELEALSFIPGGMTLLKDYLIIKDEEVAREILNGVEPEYFYSEEDVKKLLLNGSLNAFLDCLDFAPDGVLELVKDLAVKLPLNDMEKRRAILENLNFDVTKAIEVRNTKYDGEAEAEDEGSKKPTRRVSVSETQTKDSGRRTAAPKYKVIDK